MLRILNISKQYRTGDLVQRALDNVSLNLRDCEFVSVLGPSGSGKTTLLNIIGGLDRYDKGDLVINGISTKNYSDRDWDSYRNHSIGFIFQSYNLIPHQSILSNVELALTISGISSSERSRRATEALEKVGLGDQIHKKPSQLSGGQMQRVAIARALVNNPDILLADEPTGALDSETSIHVMDLLKEVAKDKLVVMVTHNPELAREYSTRIVELKDGRIISDTDPYEPVEEVPAVHRNMGKSSMSYLTALLLSFNNLWSKKARTILVSIAGSIGIIGIAMILAMSTGADVYIKNIEEESLQSYPLQINDTSLNLTTMYLSGMGSALSAKSSDADVNEIKTVTGLLSNVDSNDLKSLKTYFDSDECDIDNYVQALEYGYNITPQIYSVKDGSYRKVNPDNSFSALGFSSTETASNSLLSSFGSSNSFHAMPENKSLYDQSYEVKAGHWPEKYNECVVVLTSNGNITDLTLYALGLKDHKELETIVKNFSEGKSTETSDEIATFSYSDFLGLSYKLVSSADYYTYDKEYKVWADRSTDDKYMMSLLDKAEELTVVGVVAPLEDSSATPILSYGINYPYSLVTHLIDKSDESEIVKAQMSDRTTDVISGKKFSEMKSDTAFDMNSMFKINTDAFSDLFKLDLNSSDFNLSGVDLSAIDFSSLDLSGSVSMEELASAMPELSQEDLAKLFSGIKLNVSADAMKELFTKLLSGFADYAKKNPSSDFSRFPDAIKAYMQSDEAKTILSDSIREVIRENSEKVLNRDTLVNILSQLMSGYTDYLKSIHETESTPERLAAFLQSEQAQVILSDAVKELQDTMRDMLITTDQLEKISADLVEGYNKYAKEHELPSVDGVFSAFSDYIATEEAQQLIMKSAAGMIDTKSLEQLFSGYLSGVSSGFASALENVVSNVAKGISNAMLGSMGSLSSAMGTSLSDAFSLGSDSFSKLLSTNMDPNEMSNLMLSLLSKEDKSYENNLRKFGYADLSSPSTITIYPTNFESKQKVKAIIEDYNQRMEDAGEDDKVISYTDMVDTLMGSVTDIVNAISYVLIAFVGISLVVSSIMIGVITYISVLERKKEIGILRALGASKRNISQVFNAETFIIGALAGLIGVGVTYLLIIPTNALLHALLPEQNVIAILNPGAAVILVLLSIVLTLIGGFIPSKKAAKKDPVIALRTE